MTRRQVLALTSVLLIAAVGAAGATGQIAVAFDINRFALLRYAAYTLLGLVAVHVALAWPGLVAVVRRWSRSGRRPHAAQPPAQGSTGASVEPRPGTPAGARASGQALSASRGRAAVPLARRFAMGLGVGFAAGAGAGTALGTWQRGLSVPPELTEAGDLGVLYHRWSRPTYLGGLAKSFAPIAQPPLYKGYPGATFLSLPPAGAAAQMPVHQAIQQRRSRRGFLDRPLTLQALADVLGHAVGETDRRDPAWPFRAFPSSGALYPTETYVAAHLVEGLPAGIYHYQPRTHALVLVRPGDPSTALMRAALDQEMVASAGATLVLASYFDRAGWKYKYRAYRYALIEAGHIGQNVYVVAEALGLGCCAIWAFFDDDVNALVGIDGLTEAAVYLLAMGHATAAR